MTGVCTCQTEQGSLAHVMWALGRLVHDGLKDQLFDPPTKLPRDTSGIDDHREDVKKSPCFPSPDGREEGQKGARGEQSYVSGSRRSADPGNLPRERGSLLPGGDPEGHEPGAAAARSACVGDGAVWRGTHGRRPEIA